jgi:dimethylglycine dehydrogenase
MSCIRLEEDSFLLITAALAEWHDYELLKAALPADGALSLVNVTDANTCLVVTGPKSRDLLSGMTDADLSKGWLTHQSATIAGVAARLIRVSFAGELGWEVHLPNADAPTVYDALIAKGAVPFGMYALNTMRVEKGHKAWKGDLSTDYTLLESGLDRFIDFSKDVDFPGKTALLAERDSGPKQCAVGLEFDAPDTDAPYMAILWKDGVRVGEVTSGAFGYRVGSALGIGMLRPDLAAEGTTLEVDIFGEMRTATVREMPFWDPKNERLRA